MDIPYKRSRGGITVAVRVRPRSARAGIEGVEGEVLRVRLTAPPVEGLANKQLIEVMARAMGVAKSRVTILRGEGARTKLVAIEGLAEPPK
jgi:hypothetical protein